ncbi:D-beta-hydroxybutyrate dehydrogenase, mitochondrial-like [Liolophura sinensis]|uniref:D-beta-hydroxybutyrate dehydrogenase, mitochondrial-like n=1 Tax=Liolophura sinensis TaxID=3198878 RepID=UPI00315870FD
MTMMSVGEFLRLQAVEIAFLSVLAFLPYFVALKEVGLTLLFIGLSIGGYKLLKKKLMRRVPVEGKSVFITGCDTGIGNSLARRLVSLGFRVFAGCYRPDDEEAQALRASCGDSLHVVPLDVSSDSSVADAVKHVKEYLKDGGCLWGVVNNAGQDVNGEAELCTMDIYKRYMDINMFGTVRVTKAFLPLIRRSKGRILNVTSVKGRVGTPQTAAYTMSKYAGEGFADVLRIEMKQWGVKVILIEPGNFGGTTSILKNMNRERMKRDLEIMWEEATPEVQEDYGRDYHFAVMSGICEAVGTAPNSLAPVIDAMEDGLVNEAPKSRYLIGGSNQILDAYKTIVLLGVILPDVVTDFLIERFLWSKKIRPMALKRR